MTATASADRQAYSFAGDCEYLAMFLPVDAARVRREVPEMSGYRMIGEAVRTVFTLTDEADAAGTGELCASPGTRLARMLGAERVQADLLLRRFHMEVTAELYQPRPLARPSPA